ncbi:MAG: hypothetical protein EOL93_00610 [Epsilonproteobacteria bacterium]|nr:hypothetical protein [Campylobacterota bacterium]
MKRYISIDMKAMKENNLSLEEWVLLENIYFLSNNEYRACYASKDSLREYIGVSNGQIYKILKDLEEKGFLVKNSFGHLQVTQKYLNMVCTHSPKNGDTLQNIKYDSPKNGDETLQKMETKKENLRELLREKEKESKDSTKKAPFELPTWLNLEAWENWVQHRKEIKKPLTPTSIKQQIKLLEANKSDHVEIIETSISCGYMGLFPIKSDGKKALMDRCLNEKKRNYTIDPNNPF